MDLGFRVLAGWLLLHFFRVLLHWSSGFPLFPAEAAGVPLFGAAPGWLQCRLFLSLLSLAILISGMELLRLLPGRQQSLRYTRATLFLMPLSLGLLCLSDCRLWNGFLLELLGASLLLLLPRPLAWLRQFVAAISLVAAFSLAWQEWLGGVALQRQLGCPMGLAQLLAWLSLASLMVGTVLFTLAHRRGGPVLAGTLGVFYLMAPYAGQSIFDPGDNSLLLSLGLVWGLHRLAPDDYHSTAHTLMAGCALLLVVCNATFLVSRCIFPIQWLSPPVHVEASYWIQAGEEQFNLQCERHSQKGGRTRLDSFHSTWQRGKQRVTRNYGGHVAIQYQNEVVLDPRFWTDCPSPLLQTAWYHQQWQNWSRQRFPQWKVGASLRIDEAAP